MKTVRLFIFWQIVIFVFLINSAFAQVTLNGKQFTLNGNNFYPMVCHDIIEFAVDEVTHNPLLFPSPHAQLGPTPYQYEHLDAIGCAQDIEDNMLRMRSLGFNTMRWTGMVPNYNEACGKFFIPGWSISGGAYATVPQPPCSTNHIGSRYFNWINTLAPGDPVLDAYFLAIDKILEIAAKPTVDMQIMIDCGYGDLSKSATARANYNTLLDKLSQHLASNDNNNHFLAYIVVEEPLYYGDLGVNRKQTICDMTTTWYTTIHNNDPDHLISMSVWDVNDVIGWDADVMRCDFLQPHFYAQKMSYQGLNYFQNELNRVLASINWYSQYCPMPWIIGEVGLRANDQWTGATTEGTEAEQQAFAIATLKAVRDWGGSGYGWWDLQETQWNEDAFGLVRHGTAILPPFVNEKPAATTFENYLLPVGNPTLGQPPAIGTTYISNSFNPGDPFEHAIYSPNNNIITGTVVDQNNNPIENALVVGETYLEASPTAGQPPIYDVHYVYTDVNGYFEIIPYDFIFPPDVNHGTIEAMQISSSGSSRIFVNAFGPTYPNSNYWQIPIQTAQQYSLTRNDFNYEGTVQNQIIGLGDVKKYKAYNTLAISNTSIAGALTNGGVADFSARTDVNVLNNYEFHAEAGSEVHLFIENTLWDCNDLEFVNYNKLNNKVPDADENNSDLRFIELCFKREINDFTFEVLPNPGKDIISISISSESTSEYKFELCDLLGQSVLKGIASYPNVIVNLTSFNSGIYLLKVKQDNLEKTKRVSIIK